MRLSFSSALIKFCAPSSILIFNTIKSNQYIYFSRYLFCKCSINDAEITKKTAENYESAITFGINFQFYTYSMIHWLYIYSSHHTIQNELFSIRMRECSIRITIVYVCCHSIGTNIEASKYDVVIQKEKTNKIKPDSILHTHSHKKLTFVTFWNREFWEEYHKSKLLK